MRVIDGVTVKMATSQKVVISNIEHTKHLCLNNIVDTQDWRYGTNVAIVGGGSSLKDNLDELRRFKYIFSCGSVHDYLVENDIIPTWAVVCDPDKLVKNYLKKINRFNKTKLLVATQCDPTVIEYIMRKGVQPILWHAAGENQDPSIFGEKQVLVGGGCTVGTRSIVLAHHMGYNNLHLFGFDTCIVGDKSHAYEFDNPEIEKINEVLDINIGNDTFKMADYMLGQLFDFKQILTLIGDRVKFTVHGPGALFTLMELGKQ